MTKRASDVPLIRHGSGAPPTDGTSTSSRSECGAPQAWATLSARSTPGTATLAGSWAKTAETLSLPTSVLRGVQTTPSVGTSHLVLALVPCILHMDAAAMMGSTHSARRTPLCELGRMNTWHPASSHIITLVREAAFLIAPQRASSRQ